MGESVTIVGAGIVGICCALSLQERGIAVRLIDRGEPGQETSFGNAGVISPWSIIPQSLPGIWRSIPGMLFDPKGPLSIRPSYLPKMVSWGVRFLANSNETSVRANSDGMEFLCQDSVDLYRKHLDGTGREDLIVDSYYVHVFRQAEQADINSLDYRIRLEKGGDLDVIGPEELQRLEPALSPDFEAAILIKGQARAKSPGQIGQALAAKAADQGAEIVTAEVSGLRHTNEEHWEVTTSVGSLAADKIVMAAGVWSTQLLKSVGVSVPLAVERGYHVAFPTPSVSLENSVMDVDAKIVASSMLDGIRVAGSAEFASIDAPPNPRKKSLLSAQARAMLPGLNENGSTFWLGRRPSFPDSLPAIGPFERNKGLYAAFGHSHYGLMMAPKTGELVADLIRGRRPNVDLQAFSPDRF